MPISIPRKAGQILALLADGNVLQFHSSPRGYFKILGEAPSPWARFHRKTLLYSINTLYRQGLLDIAEGLDGITTITVTSMGMESVRRIADAQIRIPQPGEWDRKWRLVLFDVPESKKKFREAFRYHLRRLGFAEFQRSAFLFPYPCSAAVDALADQFNLKEHVVMITAESVSNEFDFKKRYGLL